MAKLLDKLYNRVIEGKLVLENGDDITKEVEESLKDSDLNVKSINAKGGAISGPLAVTGNAAVGGDLSVNGDLTTKTITQTNYNYEYDASQVGISAPEGLESTFSYFKIVVINKMLHIVFIAKFKNTTESSISPGNAISFTISNLPENISTRIYDVDGKSLNEEPTTIGQKISADWGFCDNASNIFASTNLVVINRGPTTNSIKFLLRSMPAVSANNTNIMVFRTFMVL